MFSEIHKSNCKTAMKYSINYLWCDIHLYGLDGRGIKKKLKIDVEECQH